MPSASPETAREPGLALLRQFQGLLSAPGKEATRQRRTLIARIKAVEALRRACQQASGDGHE